MLIQKCQFQSAYFSNTVALFLNLVWPWAVVVAQLVVQFLPTPEIRISNPFIGNLKYY